MFPKADKQSLSEIRFWMDLKVSGIKKFLRVSIKEKIKHVRDDYPSYSVSNQRADLQLGTIEGSRLENLENFSYKIVETKRLHIIQLV
ncbi:MAG: hypothetical protein ACLRSA_02060 [Streptococcus salivarius]